MSAPDKNIQALAHIGTTDLTEVLTLATQALPSQPQERDLQGRIFDTRQRLVAKVLQECAPDDVQDNLEQEDIWRDALPPLLLPQVRKISPFSAWRSAAMAILGLLLGTALGQALLGFGIINKPETPTYQSTGLVVLCGLLGAMFLLWLAEYFVQARSRGHVLLFGNKYRWKRFARLAGIAWLSLLALSIIRDFFGGKVGVLHFLQSVGAFLQEGLILPLFVNNYGLLLFCFAFCALLKRPLSFDHQDFEEKLAMAVEQWWAGAIRIGALLQENISLKNDPTKAAWHKVGIELYSLAGELPEARKDWLESRLQRLGIEVAREEGELFWTDALSERYTPLGHIALGDACFVDEPPVLEQGLLVRKGTMRKVRR